MGVEENAEERFIGPPQLTRFEKTRIVGARALQLSLGAPLLCEVPDAVQDLVELAIIELEQKIADLIVLVFSLKWRHALRVCFPVASLKKT